MKKLNWLDHIANLLVVILGISIAFYLESYKEEKANAMQEEKYMLSLAEDLTADFEAIDTLNQWNTYMSNSLVKLTTASTGRPYEEDSLVIYLLSIQYNPPFTPQLTTYESLKASGQMGLIKDFELRNQLVELYEQYYRGVEQYDESIDQHLRDFYKPFFFKNVEFIGRNQVRKEFLRKAEFRNIMFAYRYLFLAKSGFYRTVQNQIDDTLEKLKKQNK